MGNNSKQTKAWASEFGVEYTDRNLMTVEEMDVMYKKRFGITRTKMNDLFLSDLDRDIKILEVGCNIGLQLEFLQRAGFTNLYGIDLSSYAVELARKKISSMTITEGSALAIPYKDNEFDLVFTSGVLIHINPEELNMVLNEILRCSKKYIWGFEYYSLGRVQIEYRKAKETTDLLWKANYHELYFTMFSKLDIVRAKFYKYTDSDNEDIMFLLRKR